MCGEHKQQLEEVAGRAAHLVIAIPSEMAAAGQGNNEAYCITGIVDNTSGQIPNGVCDALLGCLEYWGPNPGPTH